MNQNHSSERSRREKGRATSFPPAVPSSLPPRILLIEDDESFAQVLAFALERAHSCDVKLATDSFEAGNLMSHQAFDLVITDWRLPAVSGFSALRQAERGLELDPMAPSEWFGLKKVPVIVITVCEAAEIEREKRLKGRFQFLGVVSKEQSLEEIMQELELLYANMPSAGATRVA